MFGCERMFGRAHLERTNVRPAGTGPPLPPLDPIFGVPQVRGCQDHNCVSRLSPPYTPPLLGGLSRGVRLCRPPLVYCQSSNGWAPLG